MATYKDDIRRLLRRREVGGKPSLGTNNRVHSQLSSSIRCVNSWDPRQTVNNTHHGGIFNFGFSTDGSLLAAACEKKSVLMFDPHNAKLLSVKNEAHTDCVNCVRFLDSRTFVTCSDDTTVCLWDARYMKHTVRTLRHGHSNWVKNIEYEASQGYLLTSGFDGCIYMWDINKYTEDGVDHRRLFHTSGLMRSKLTPDGTKLVIATAGGYLMVIHDLDLSTLQHDLNGFKPNMYRLMQMNQWVMQAYNYNHLFTAKRNRVELISDFPAQDDAEMIASLEVHPQGWCAVSRNTSADDNSEWTCIHDIQGSLGDVEEVELDDDHEEEEDYDDSAVQASSSSSTQKSPESNSRDTAPSDTSDVTSSDPGTSSDNHVQRPGTFRSANGLLPSQVPSSVRRRFVAPVWVPSLQSAFSRPERSNDDNVTDSDTDSDTVVLSDRNNQNASQRDSSSSAHSQPSVSGAASGMASNATAETRHMELGESVTFIFRSGTEQGENLLTLYGNDTAEAPPKPRIPQRIHRNIPRLTHYVEEPNVGRGFIKEICFSNDGRLLCSPFAFGVRVLAFNCQCQELCDCVPGTPGALHEVTSNISHSNVVVTVGYSPTHCLLVSGCLNGKIDFHQPVL